MNGSPYDEGWNLDAPPMDLADWSRPYETTIAIHRASRWYGSDRPPNGCEKCGARLYFSQRLAKMRFCRVCAAYLGVIQIADPAFGVVMVRARRVAPWMRWTIWLAHALQWRVTDGMGGTAVWGLT